MKKTFIISAFLCVFINLSGQDFRPEEADCLSYYDTILRKKVYETVNILPSYDKEGIINFAKIIIQELKEKNIILSQEEALRSSRVVITFVVSEKGCLENVHIVGKEIKDYSIIDNEVLNIIKHMSCKQWNPGVCNNKKVSTLVYVPLNIRFN